MGVKKLMIASNLSLPIDAVTQTFAILAKRGVGKTYTAMVMAEEFIKTGLPVVVVDPVGVCWGLRASASGKSGGLPIIIFGGDRGDVPISEADGALVADLVVNERLSIVLDLSLFRKGEMVRFMTAFAERIYQKNRDPLHMILDEADAFAPQKPMKGQERMLGAMEDIVRRGRARGLGVTLVTQRSAVLNKDVLTQIEVLVALRTIAPQDRIAIKAWIDVHGTLEEQKILMESLPSLPIGTAWFWSPGFLDIFRKVKIRKRRTFDSSATPKASEKIKAPKRLMKVDIEALKGKLEATIEKKKAEDPRVLRKEIARLNKELLKKAPATGSATRATRPEIKEVPVFTKKELALLEKFTTMLNHRTRYVEKSVSELSERTKSETKILEDFVRIFSGKKPYVPVQISRPAEPVRKASRSVSDNSEDVNLNSGERRILEALARQHPARYTKTQLGTMSKFKATGGTFGTYFGRLKRYGLIAVDADKSIQITEDGLIEVGHVPDKPQTAKEVVAMWKKSIGGGAAKILDELVGVYPESIPRDELGERTDYEPSGGTFGTYLGVLRRNGLIENQGGEISAAAVLFTEPG